jgi:hypothetical protein
MVAQDDNAHVIAAACIKLEPCEDAAEAEARAALTGLSISSSMGFRKIILERDSAATVDLV